MPPRPAPPWSPDSYLWRTGTSGCARRGVARDINRDSSREPSTARMREHPNVDRMGAVTPSLPDSVMTEADLGRPQDNPTVRAVLRTDSH
jgi:hypothetical protein